MSTTRRRTPYPPQRQQTDWAPFIIFSILVTGVVLTTCVLATTAMVGGARRPTEPITVTILVSPEKQSILTRLATAYNKTSPRYEDRPVTIDLRVLESGGMIDRVLAGDEQPTAIAPASSTWINQLNAEWRTRTQGEENLAANPRSLMVSPIVIGMWEPMAQAMGYPQAPLGWRHIISATLDPKGWGAFGKAEWGPFRFAHASPDTDSGRLATLAEFFAGAGKVRSLTEADLQNPAVRDYVRSIQRGIVQYGESDAALVELMRQRGPSALSAAVMEEQALIAFNRAQPPQRLVAIYPIEGTFWADHPYAILRAPWVTAEHQAAAKAFLDYLLDVAQQRLILAEGFRPANLSLSLDGSPINPAFGADPSQPKTLLAVPDPQILAAVRNAWTLTKKPANIILVADVSGSMVGEKLERAKQGLSQFVASISPSDRVGLMKFSSTVYNVVPLQRLDAAQRAALTDEINRLAAGGNTALYQATREAVAQLVRLNDKESINAVVLMTDGKETAGGSRSSLISYLKQIQKDGERTGVTVKVFCIAYGSDADMGVLTEIADATIGKALPGTPDTIKRLYRLISQYF